MPMHLSVRPITIAAGVAALLAARAERSPAPSHLEAVAYDAARHRLVLFGGTRRDSAGAYRDSDETWEWDGTRWTLGESPPDGVGARRGHAMAYDARSRRVLVVGGVRTRTDPGTGRTRDEPLDDTWTYDGRAWTPGPPVPVTSGHALVQGPADGVLLLAFAGREAHHPRRLALWRLTPNGWVFADSSGPTLSGPIRAAYDPRRGVLVVPVLNDSASAVWEWNDGGWRSLRATGPASRSRHVVAYDGTAGHTLVLGGRDDASRSVVGDAWAWDGARWTALAPSSATPSPRASASVAADAQVNRFFVFGGLGADGALHAQLWIRSAGGWSVAAPE